MASLPALLRKQKDLFRQYLDLERELADVDRQIIESAGTSRPRRPHPTKTEMIDLVKETVKVLRDAGEPLPRREIAARLGISVHATSYRLAKAIKLRFVDKAGLRYQVTNVVPAF